MDKLANSSFISETARATGSNCKASSSRLFFWSHHSPSFTGRRTTPRGHQATIKLMPRLKAYGCAATKSSASSKAPRFEPSISICSATVATQTAASSSRRRNSSAALLAWISRCHAQNLGRARREHSRAGWKWKIDSTVFCRPLLPIDELSRPSSRPFKKQRRRRLRYFLRVTFLESIPRFRSVDSSASHGD